MRVAQLFSVLVFGLTVSAHAERVHLDAVAAYVNDTGITVGAVVRSSATISRLIQTTTDPDVLNAAYREALDAVIGERLIIDAYEAQKRIQIPDSMVQQRMDAIVREVFQGDRTILLEALAEEGLDYELWKRQMRDQIIVRTMRNVKVSSSIRVSPVSVRKRYETMGISLKTPDSAELAMIVLPGDKMDLAHQLYQQTVEGADFGELARQHSIGPRADAGGERGRMQLDMLRDELSQAVREGVAEGLTKPVAAGDQIYIIRVVDYQAGALPPFAEVSSRIEEELRIEKEQARYQSWVNSMRRDAYVKIVESAPF